MMSNILFSMTQDERLASKIVRIASPDDVDEFRTELLSYDAKGEGSLNWRQAWQDKETQLWSVMEYHRTNAGQRLQTPVMNSVCFFDALHSCAEFERDRKIEGAAIATELFADEDTKNMLHHLDTAELAGQPHDSNDMPHPAVEGQILTSAEACFDDHAYSVAKQTRERDLLPVTALVANDNMLAFLKIEHNSNLPALSGEDVMTQGSLHRDFQRAVDDGDFLVKALKNYIYINYTDNAKTPMAGQIFNCVMTLGIITTFDLLGCSPQAAPVLFFKKKHRQFDRRIKELPDCRETDILKEFSKAALSALYMEEAVRFYIKYKRNNQGEKQLQKGLVFVEKAAQAAGLPDADALRLKKAYMEGKYRKYKEFLVDLRKKHDNLKEALAPVL